MALVTWITLVINRVIHHGSEFDSTRIPPVGAVIIIITVIEVDEIGL